jgi:hypothetical protein
VAGSCEHGNEPSGFIKGKGFCSSLNVFDDGAVLPIEASSIDRTHHSRCT